MFIVQNKISFLDIQNHQHIILDIIIEMAFVDNVKLWKNRVPGEPLDSVSNTRWNSGHCPVDKCLICGALDDCFESKFEWGEPQKP
jgi:hypothetical protein